MNGENAQQHKRAPKYIVYQALTARQKCAHRNHFSKRKAVEVNMNEKITKERQRRPLNKKVWSMELLD